MLTLTPALRLIFFLHHQWYHVQLLLMGVVLRSNPTTKSDTMPVHTPCKTSFSLGPETHSLQTTIHRLLVWQAHSVQHHISSDIAEHRSSGSLRGSQLLPPLGRIANDEDSLTPQSHRSSRPSSIPSCSSSQTMSHTHERLATRSCVSL